MPKLNAVAYGVTRRLPKVISPRDHAIADYVAVGLFAVAGGLFWRRNKPAATAALICGTAELALNLITDYPGGVAGIVSFPDHGRADMALAALTATIPDLLGFRKGRKFFLLQSGALTVAANLTQFKSPRDYPVRRSRRSRSAFL
ncbi:MAG: hypothetical protein ACRD2U_15360 [Terriglobales bacterium]